ncbi:hypothetical protein [Burkholderia stagnalis]|uniref:hypothetical protein n=1 Tax=Burkholderia stagnalis TaxID=1503054 RepID=UPI000F57DEB6|nr:hypothetical protein [Burkholderia stagnalis]MDY7804245.1 hypothetical protein [Burkholderia stagnalis]
MQRGTHATDYTLARSNGRPERLAAGDAVRLRPVGAVPDRIWRSTCAVYCLNGNHQSVEIGFAVSFWWTIASTHSSTALVAGSSQTKSELAEINLLISLRQALHARAACCIRLGRFEAGRPAAQKLGRIPEIRTDGLPSRSPHQGHINKINAL